MENFVAEYGIKKCIDYKCVSLWKLIKILLFSGEHVLLMLQVRYTSLARVVVLWKTQQWLCKSFRSNFISCNQNCTLIFKTKTFIRISNLIYELIVGIKG
jgi:hypothetical protein